jgi:hypothetical protein
LAAGGLLAGEGAPAGPALGPRADGPLPSTSRHPPLETGDALDAIQAPASIPRSTADVAEVSRSSKQATGTRTSPEKATTTMTRMSLARGVLGFIGWLTTVATPTSADFIVNGSFEEPIVPVGGYTNYLAGSTAITGWTVVGIDSAVTSTSFTQSGITFQARDGDQWLDLAGIDSNSSSSGVTQDVSTEIGRVYLLTFHVGSATDGVFFFPSTVDLSIDGGARMSFRNPAAPTDALDWKMFAVRFTATQSLTNITFYNGGEPDNYLNALDDVRLTVVPEPPAGVLGVLGILGILAARPRR